MTEPQMLETEHGRRLAYHRTPGDGPGVVFLGGFRSDMTGTKAIYLEDWARAQGRSFLRFDYSGHGASSGAFEEGTIGAWVEDAAAAITAATNGPQVLVGSSMGGWIALLVARRIAARVHGLVGIAAAPDFTEDMRRGLTDAERDEVARTGRLTRPSDYADGPYVFTQQLLEDGRQHCLLDAAIPLDFPVRFLQGTADTDVPVSVALRLLERAEGPDIRLTLVKNADHRFSSPDCLAAIIAAIDEVTKRGGGAR